MKGYHGLAYTLDLGLRIRIHPTFPISLLEPFYGSSPQRPDAVYGSDEYEVEAIIGYNSPLDDMFYHVKWAGYDESENTWEPRKNLEHAQDLLREYEESNGLIVRPKNKGPKRRRGRNKT